MTTKTYTEGTVTVSDIAYAWKPGAVGQSVWQDFLADRYLQEWQGEPWCRNV